MSRIINLNHKSNDIKIEKQVVDQLITQERTPHLFEALTKLEVELKKEENSVKRNKILKTTDDYSEVLTSIGLTDEDIPLYQQEIEPKSSKDNGFISPKYVKLLNNWFLNMKEE